MCGGAELAALKGCLLSLVTMESHGDASEHQRLLLETKFNTDRAQMCAQAGVGLVRAHNNRFIPEPEQYLLGQRTLSILKALTFKLHQLMLLA